MTNNSELYVLRKTGTHHTYYMRTHENVGIIHSAKKFANAVDAIDFMLSRHMLDDYDLLKIEDIKNGC